MLTTQILLDIFRDKLAKENSLDAAFTKAVWVAYNRGLADGRAEQVLAQAERIELLEQQVHILLNAERR
jgi:hypothetical protein